ncbi:MAG: hypothetical protein LBD25_02025 [Coriobacteriales bacterium]|jgi:hypothetical protein|nr:hypothetical protein [Coriobacteriales bacterium]
MTMGSTGTVNMTPEMISNAKTAVSDYRGIASGLHTRLGDAVTSLVPGSFSGSAAEGFKYFYDNNIATVTDTAEVGTLGKLLKALDDILDSILKQIPGPEALDDELGDGNKQQQEGSGQ